MSDCGPLPDGVYAVCRSAVVCAAIESEEALAENDEGAASQVERLGESSVLVGFRPVMGPGAHAVLGAPARADELSLGQRRRDLGILVLFATVP